MYLDLLGDRKLDELLERLDQREAHAVRAGGCREAGCTGQLHAARYPRKPCGPQARRTEKTYRESFCCARRDCRARMTPASLRFLGRKVYLASVVVLISILRCGATPKRVQRLRELSGASARTIQRWRAWWVKEVPRTPLWRVMRAAFVAPDQAERDLPLSALECFTASDARERLVQFLRFLLPLTGGALST